jgi:hypothetical protein
LAVLVFEHPATAQVNSEPPDVARISLIHGEVSMQRGDSGDTSAVTLNTPLVAGDKVFTGSRSRAEVQLDWANMFRLNENARADIATLERTRIQVQLAEGLAFFSVLEGSEADVEINTPNVAVIPLRDGRYRIEVTPAGETFVTVREGEADISTPEGSTRLKKNQTISVRGADASVEFQVARAPSSDDWDKWNNDRDRIIARAESWRRTNRYYTGAGDLDAYGKWSHVSDYGWVWTPRVAIGWAPYRHGRWIWQAHWGWTWVAHEPWGWAPYHYGRWFVHRGSWVWWPGPAGPRYRPIWAPAYVSFFGFGKHAGFSFGFGSIGWIPAGPCDPVHPWWGRHRRDFNVVNITNVTNVTNIYNIRNVNVIAPLRSGRRDSNVHNMLVNDRVRLGVSSVSAERFGRGGGDIRTVSTGELRQGQVMTGNVPVVPSRESLRSSDRPASIAGTMRPKQDRFYSRSVPSRQRESFTEETARVQQNIESRLRTPGERASSGSAGRSDSNGNNPASTAPRQEERPSEVRSEVRTQRPNAPVQRSGDAQQQTEMQRQSQAGWRKFGARVENAPANRNGQAQTSEAGTPRLRTPRQMPQNRSGSAPQPQPNSNGADNETNNRPDPPRVSSPNPAGENRTQPRPGSMRLGSRRVSENTPDAGGGDSRNSPASPNGWRRFSGGPRSASTGEPDRGEPSLSAQRQSGEREPLPMSRPIIRQRNQQGGQQPSTSPRRAQPDAQRGNRPSAPQAAPSQAPQRGTARGSAGSSGAPSVRSAPQSGGRASSGNARSGRSSAPSNTARGSAPSAGAMRQRGAR